MERAARGGEEGVAPDGHESAAASGGQRLRPADQSSERQVIRWEKFLPRRSLRVLLVEYDDSTRHIVAALLRKHYSFDLVLTEVAMPSFLGIGLLSNLCVVRKDSKEEGIELEDGENGMVVEWCSNICLLLLYQ